MLQTLGAYSNNNRVSVGFIFVLPKLYSTKCAQVDKIKIEPLCGLELAHAIKPCDF